MVIRYLLSALLLLFSLHVSAGFISPQRCTYDSLVSIGVSLDTDDSDKLNAYYALADMIRDSVPDVAFTYAIKGYKLSMQENSYPGRAIGRKMLGGYFTMKRKYNLALENYLSAFKLYVKLHDTLNQIEVLGNIAMIHVQVRKYPEAIIYFKRAVALSEKIENEESIGHYLERIATAYIFMARYDSAMLFLDESLAHYKNVGSIHGMLKIVNSKSAMLMNQRKFHEALALYHGTDFSSEAEDKYFLGVIYTRIGHCYSELGDHRTSLKYNLMALGERAKANNPTQISSSMINIGGDYLMLKKYDSAMLYIEAGLKQARYYHLPLLMENAYKKLFQYFYRDRDFKTALVYYELKAAMRDTIMLENNNSSIVLIETTQQLQSLMEANFLLAKQNAHQALNIQKQLLQSRFIDVIIGLALIMVMIILVQFLHDRFVRRRMQHLNDKLTLEMKERWEMQIQTKEREEQFRFIMTNSLDVITRVSKDFKHVFSSPYSEQLFDLTPDEMLSCTPYSLIHPDYHQYTDTRVENMMKTRAATEVVYPAKRKDGTYSWVESVLNPIFDEKTGEYRELVAVTRDIQDRKIKEMELMEGTKQKENLLKEIHHRVKNNFAILVSLINMQKGQTKNPELVQSLTNLQLRIRSMALVHEMLYRSSDFERISFKDYLQTLASVIAGTYNRRDIQMRIEADESVISIEASIPLGLIVNEILSNAYKHAFPDGQGGNIYVRLINDAESPDLNLIFQDNGVGLPEDFKIEDCKTMGLQIVNILVHQIDGKLVINNRSDTVFNLTFPKIAS